MKVHKLYNVWYALNNLNHLSMRKLLLLTMTFVLIEIPAQALIISTTASTSMTETLLWDVTKTANVSTLDTQIGESFSVEYSVTVEQIGSFYDDFGVDGVITITNGPIDFEWITAVSDVVSPGISADINYDGSVYDGSPFMIARDETIQLDYSAFSPDIIDGINTVTVESSDGNYSASAPYDFSTASVTYVDDWVTVVDHLVGGLGMVYYLDGPTTFTYSYTFDPFYEAGTYTVSNDVFLSGYDRGVAALGVNDSYDVVVNVAAPVPEPSTFLLLGCGLAGLGLYTRRRMRT